MTLGKRLFDLWWAALGLAVLWPVFLVVALLITLQDGGPVFFRQWRVGHRGRQFRIWKFRTMLSQASERGPALTIGADSRITRVGRLLRRLKIDELPQLLNVMAGEMSLVGPRPELSCYVDLYSPAQRAVLDLMPGMTDAASVHYSDESALLAGGADPERTYVQVIMPTKVDLSLEYAARATRWSDFMIILATLRDVVRTLWRRPANGQGRNGGPIATTSAS